VTPFYPQFAEGWRALLRDLEGRRVLIAGHARPDGDCIGSQIALARVLRALGHDVVCANPDPVPRRLRFLTGDEPFFTADTLPAGDRAVIHVDCADRLRPGAKLDARFPGKTANFDHHVSNNGYARHNFVDADSAAACEILAGLFFDLGLPVDAPTAQALYAGILTDTGQFRFHATTRRTFLLAAELMARGAVPAQAGYELYERESPGKLMLLQRFLASLRYECGGRVCIGILPAGIFAETGTTAEDTEGLVDYARAIDGVDVGVLVEERPDGLKASLRGKEPAFRLDQVAALFNGGGHACAAGLNLKDIRPADFLPRLVAAIGEQLAAASAANPSD
jgi:phosphoesterase RecJ-like protein